MIIPSFEVYCTLKPEQKAVIRQHMRALGMKPYHGNLGKPNVQKGQEKPHLRGPQPPRPHRWKIGPDPELHQYYDIWHRHRAQCLWRGEDYDLTFWQWRELWGDLITQRGRGTHSLVMTRRDWEKSWHLQNVEIVPRLEHMKRVGEMRRLQNL